MLFFAKNRVYSAYLKNICYNINGRTLYIVGVLWPKYYIWIIPPLKHMNFFLITSNSAHVSSFCIFYYFIYVLYVWYRIEYVYTGDLSTTVCATVSAPSRYNRARVAPSGTRVRTSSWPIACRYSARVEMWMFPSPPKTWLTALRVLPRALARADWVIPDSSKADSRLTSTSRRSRAAASRRLPSSEEDMRSCSRFSHGVVRYFSTNWSINSFGTYE